MALRFVKKVPRKERKQATCSVASGDSDWGLIGGGRTIPYVDCNETKLT